MLSHGFAFRWYESFHFSGEHLEHLPMFAEKLATTTREWLKGEDGEPLEQDFDLDFSQYSHWKSRKCFVDSQQGFCQR